MTKFTPKKIKDPRYMDIRVDDYHDAQESTAMYMDKFEEILYDYDDPKTTQEQREEKYAALEDRYALAYGALGLAGEAGEVANKIKKYLRGDGDLDYAAMTDELGDVFWYLFDICGTLGISPEEVMRRNALKLQDRKERGKIQGDGDNR